MNGVVMNEMTYIGYRIYKLFSVKINIWQEDSSDKEAIVI